MSEIIKAGLRQCIIGLAGACESCPYDQCADDCFAVAAADALVLIEHLEERIAELEGKTE